MGDHYRIIECSDGYWYRNPKAIEDEINLRYEQGWEFVQIVTKPDTSMYWLYFKRRTDLDQRIDPNLKFNFEPVFTLREFLDSGAIKGHPARIYSIQNHSVVGSIIDGKELIPESVLKYKYFGYTLEHNKRLNDGSYVYLITVE